MGTLLASGIKANDKPNLARTLTWQADQRVARLLGLARQTLVISAFCGTGKTYICENSSKNVIEFECWKYDKNDFPENYVIDVKASLGKVDAIFISTNPLALHALNELGVKSILIYPSLQLKSEYIERYKKRGSSNDFVTTLSKNWDNWINEIKGNKYCQYVELKYGEYISTVLSEIA